MKLNLKNPIIFFDIESTGLNVATDRIVEISMVKVMPDGSTEVKTRRINPTIHISEEASRIHGIHDEDVRNEPTFSQIAKSLAKWMEGCDIAGYNSNKFDIPVLYEEFLRAGVDFDFTLSAAYKFYCHKDLEHAHSAEADTVATYEILQAQLDKYSGTLQNDINFLADFSSKTKFADYAGRIIYNDKDVPVFNFGKHKGKPVAEVLRTEPSYYAWMMNGDFTLDTKKVLTEIKIKSSGK